ncbi:MAG: hypothetical protein II472_00565 [Lachnospiraceae bacterium]|nr:hypothetical protein [Lachnospiraceae bacterium]
MANSEDYLDGLLNSVKTVRDDVQNAEQMSAINAARRQNQRNKINPSDDFMQATGLDDFEPEVSSHSNLRRVLSEDDFLREFEAELGLDDADTDAIMRDFEEEMERDEMEFQKSLQNEQTEDADQDEDLNQDDDKSFLENIENIVNQAKEEIENGTVETGFSSELTDSFGDVAEIDESGDDEESEESFGVDDLGNLGFGDDEESEEESDAVESDSEETGSEESDGEESAADDTEESAADDAGDAEESVEESSEEIDLSELESIAGDADLDLSMDNGEEPDLGASEASEEDTDEPIGVSGENLLEKYAEMEAENMLNNPEESLLDENADVDLMDLLSGDGDLDDISQLLNADEEQEELPEAQEEFEAQADAAAGTDPNDLAAGLDVDPSEEGEEAPAEKKGLGAIIEKIKSIFAKKDHDEEGEETVDVGAGEAEDMNQENMDILKTLEGEGAGEEEAPKKEKKKKEKKPKEPKPKKEKKPKPPKEKKPKKEKQPDNSPKIPMKYIIVFLLLAVSIVVLINVGQSVLSHRNSKANAELAFGKGDYITAYESLAGKKLTKDEDIQLFAQSRLLSDLQKRQHDYNLMVSLNKYDLALDSLIIGVVRYTENVDQADQYQVREQYDAIGTNLIDTLNAQYGLTQEDAISMSHMNREQYSIRINEIVDELNLGR